MIGKLHGFVSRFAGWLTLAPFGLLTAAFSLCFFVIDTPVNLARFAQLTGGAPMLDARLYYTAGEAYAAMAAYGEQGRRFYQFFLLGDFLYLVGYAGFLCSAITLALQRALPPESRAHRLNLLPLAAGAMDYFENFSVLAMLNRYPAHAAAAEWTAGGFTLCKWLLVASSVAVLAWGLAKAARKGLT